LTSLRSSASKSRTGSAGVRVHQGTGTELAVPVSRRGAA
jgi:hypothetical protein